MTAEITPHAGLCSTCNNAPSCFHRARRGAALYCELFDNYVADPTNDLPASTPAARVVASNGYRGLCMNCEHRGTCRHPRPEGGIWHCENYE